MISAQTLLDVARDYYVRGWMPLPVPDRSKTPGFKGWQNFAATEAELPKYFNGNPQNIGVLLGAASSGRLDVDLDCLEATALVARFLPQTDAIFGRASKPSSHWQYISDLATVKFQDVDGSMLLELRSTGCQTIFPPSIHPSGEVVAWESEGDPAQVDPKELRAATAKLAAACIIARHWPNKGSRHDAAKALAGGLLRAGWSEDVAKEFIEAIAGAAGDAEIGDRIRTVASTADNLANGKKTTGWPALAGIIDPRVVDRVYEWLDIRDSPTSSPPTNWRAPEPLPDDLLPVPALPLEVLPETLAPWLSDIADRMQCPLEFPAVTSVVALAATIGSRLAVRPKRRDDWMVVPNLWGGIVGRPGILKTPALEEALKPVNRLVAKAREAHADALKSWQFDQMVHDARRDKLRDDIKKIVKEGGDAGGLRAELDSMQACTPVERRYIVNDPTVEKLGELLNQNPRGLLLFRDELTGWLRSLDREGHEADRAFYLEAWGGGGSYTYDRIGRGTLRIQNVTVSILGGIQPGPLSQYLRNTLAGGLADDGMMQRFQLLVYPDAPRQWRNVDRWPEKTARDKVNKLFENLDGLEPGHVGAEEAVDEGGKPFLRFADDAQEFFDGWRADLETELRSGTLDHPALEAHLAKYRSLMPSLALLFHLTDAVSGSAEGQAVSLNAAMRAAGWCSFLFEHARRIYGLALNAEIALAKLVLERIRRGELPDVFTARDVYRKQWAGLGTAKAVVEPLTILEDYGWVQAFAMPSGTEGGRPTVHYAVHPSLKGGTR